MNVVVPIKDVRIKNRIDLWITSEILHLLQLKDKRAWKVKTNKHKNELRQEFKRVRNKATRGIIQAKADDFRPKMEEYRNNQRSYGNT